MRVSAQRRTALAAHEASTSISLAETGNRRDVTLQGNDNNITVV
jgi:hypothetical protein